jgi:hypothetical protein
MHGHITGGIHWHWHLLAQVIDKLPTLAASTPGLQWRALTASLQIISGTASAACNMNVLPLLLALQATPANKQARARAAALRMWAMQATIPSGGDISNITARHSLLLPSTSTARHLKQAGGTLPSNPTLSTTHTHAAVIVFDPRSRGGVSGVAISRSVANAIHTQHSARKQQQQQQQQPGKPQPQEQPAHQPTQQDQQQQQPEREQQQPTPRAAQQQQSGKAQQQQQQQQAPKPSGSTPSSSPVPATRKGNRTRYKVAVLFMGYNGEVPLPCV